MSLVLSLHGRNGTDWGDESSKIWESSFFSCLDLQRLFSPKCLCAGVEQVQEFWMWSGWLQPLPEPWVLTVLVSQSSDFSCPGFCRVLLNIMYLIVETVRQEAEGDKPEWKSMRQTFRAELGEDQEPG